MMDRYVRVDQKKGEPQVIQDNEVRFLAVVVSLLLRRVASLSLWLHINFCGAGSYNVLREDAELHHLCNNLNLGTWIVLKIWLQETAQKLSRPAAALHRLRFVIDWVMPRSAGEEA